MNKNKAMKGKCVFCDKPTNYTTGGVDKRYYCLACFVMYNASFRPPTKTPPLDIKGENK